PARPPAVPVRLASVPYPALVAAAGAVAAAQWPAARAAQAAQALEAAAGEEERPERSRPQRRERAWKPWLALAAVGACAVLGWHTQRVSPPAGPMSGNPLRASDADTAAVGDPAPTAPRASTSPPTGKKPLAQGPLPEPRPEQLRPDKKGQCPAPKQVPINGGCWLDVSTSTDAQTCAASGYVLFQGKCLVPALAPSKTPQPTSGPSEER
ncbi:MAG TPA: hypothetical protein VF815_35955, partial [Myxococcaceae bacterium]